MLKSNNDTILAFSRKMLTVCAILWIVNSGLFIARASNKPWSGQTYSLDGDDWLVAIDPKNEGREKHWERNPVPEAKPAVIPWGIQSVFPGYYGVAWYWRDFMAPDNHNERGRYLLKFWSVNYMCDVWINGQHAGMHEGSDSPFILDITDLIKPGSTNQISVRLLTPTSTPVDGFVGRQIPGGAFIPGGGIEDSVELMTVPAVWVEDLYVKLNASNGVVHVEVSIRNSGSRSVEGQLGLSIMPGAGGETLKSTSIRGAFPPGGKIVKADIQVDNPQLWEPKNPNLYQVTARIATDNSQFYDDQSVRVGFRDFIVKDGYFVLNGQRIFLRSCLSGDDGIPIFACPPWDYTLIRRELFAIKAMGFNSLRYCGFPARRQVLDLCDEIGLMVQQESRASMLLADSAQMEQRFHQSVASIIKRDRNHPSVVMWGLLNEVSLKSSFLCALGFLPSVRSLDDDRLILLNSGGFDGLQDIGSDFSMWFSPHVAGGMLWSKGQLILYPGTDPEYTVTRWTAPISGNVTISAAFESAIKVPPGATVDVHVLHNQTHLLDSWINLNGKGDSCSCSNQISVTVGDTVDCVVGYGSWAPDFDSTSWDNTWLNLAITYASGKTYNAGSEYLDHGNPNKVWSYGFEKVKPGAPPDPHAFVCYKNVLKNASLGSYSNPDSMVWETGLNDRHFYPRTPHTINEIEALRELKWNGSKVFLSEYGVGSGLDLIRERLYFEQIAKVAAPQGGYASAFLDDWQKWKLEECFDSPEDYFKQSLAEMAECRAVGLNAIRADPDLVGVSLTCGVDPGVGDGLLTAFRELKPGTVDAMFDGFAPLRWCLFAEPVNLYRGKTVKLEAVLANEDVLKPGDYPVRLEVFGPGSSRVFDRTITVKISDPQGNPEPPFAIPVFSEDVTANWPAGKYRFIATFEGGAAAAGRASEFYVVDALETPKVDGGVVLWGEDAVLTKWLTEHGIHYGQFTSTPQATNEVILVGSTVPSPGGVEAFKGLATRIAQGATAIFLDPHVLAIDNQPASLSPLGKKGILGDMSCNLLPKDVWVKRHPIFDGLPTGGLMDKTIYRDTIPDTAWTFGSETNIESISGAINTSLGYNSGLLVAIEKEGQGQIILNTLRIRENLGRNPRADRLLINMLRYGMEVAAKPTADIFTSLKK